jgi:zinc protease
VFVVQATARPGVPLSKIEPIITCRDRAAGQGWPDLRGARAREDEAGVRVHLGLERIGGFGGKADVLNQYNVFLGDPGKVDADLQRYRALTPADVQRATARWLDTPNRAIIRFHPEKSQRPANAMTFDRTVMPPLGTDRPFTAPTAQTSKLANGLEVIVVERHDLPKVNVTLVSKAGAVGDPAGKAGVANLTMATIDLGTPTRKALEIEDALGALGTTLGGGAGRESARLTFDVLSRNLAPALEIVADVAQHPTFPEDEFSREKKRVLDGIAQADRNGNALAQRIQPMLAFGNEHPTGGR